jgi:hypothetical protein
MMRPIFLVVSTVLICQAGTVAIGQAAVSRDQFPPKTTGDLIALCQATKDDPLMTPAVNFCNGFAEGAVEIALGYETIARRDRQPFCLPTPRPSHNEAVAQFAAWANAAPGRLDDPPGLGLMRFLVQQYPCPHSAVTKSHAK